MKSTRFKYIGAPTDIKKTGKAILRGIPSDKRIGNKITPIAITDPTPYALMKIKAVTKITKMAASITFFLPAFAVRCEMAGAIP